MLDVLCVAWLVLGQDPGLKGPINVSHLTTTKPAVVAEVNTGSLKGEPRQLAWSPDGQQLYLQAVAGDPPHETTLHYVLDVASGRLAPADAPPAWAVLYWTTKQDRVAPGTPGLEITIEQAQETIKAGPGPAGVLDRTSNPSSVAMTGPSPENLASGAHGNQKARVVRLRLAGEEIAKWVNERPIPGLRFSWGPSGGEALVFVGDGGRLVFLDGRRRRADVAEVRDALLPAWSGDGTRLACLRKTGRREYAVVWMGVGLR